MIFAPFQYHIIALENEFTDEKKDTSDNTSYQNLLMNFFQLSRNILQLNFSFRN